MKHYAALSAAIVVAACSQSPDELFASAQAAFAAHDYVAARLHVASALQADPANRAMLLLQARTLLALGDGDGAGAALDKLAGGQPPRGELAELAAEAALLRKAPEAVVGLLEGRATPEAERLRALAALQNEDRALAVKHFGRAVELGGNPRAFADFASLKLMEGDIAGAREMLARARQLAPNGIDTLLTGGRLAAIQGDLGAALAQYERAAKLYPASLAALVGKAGALGDLGRLDEMDAVIKSAAEFAPGDPDVLYLRARSAVARKDWAKVRDLVQPVEGTLPQQSPVRLFYAQALVQLGQAELASAQVAPIARSQPANRAVRRILAEAQLAAGNAPAALETFRPVADSPQARPEELELMARIARAAGDASAVQYQARSRAPSPQTLAADIAEGDAAIRQGAWARAATAYERILAATDGRNVMVLNNMAHAQSMLGNHARALEFADKARGLAPDNASVLDTAGWVRWRAGREPDEARRLLRAAAAKAPENATIRAHLAEATRAPD